MRLCHDYARIETINHFVESLGCLAWKGARETNILALGLGIIKGKTDSLGSLGSEATTSSKMHEIQRATGLPRDSKKGSLGGPSLGSPI